MWDVIASATSETTPHATRAAKAIVPALVFAAVLALSIGSGRPAKLPGAALGWVWLLHVERAAVALGAVGTVWLVGWRALHGHFPMKFGNIEYAGELLASADTVNAHEKRLEMLEDYVRTVEASDDAVKSDLEQP